MANLLLYKNLNLLNQNSKYFLLTNKLLKKNVNNFFFNHFKALSTYNNENLDSKKLDLSFSNSENAYKSKKTFDLIRAYFVLKATSYSFIVNNNEKLIKLGQNFLGKKVFNWFIKNTFYAHFVAGEDENEIKPIIKHLNSFGVKSILDYSAEEDLAEDELNKVNNQQNIFHSVNVPINEFDENKLKQFKLQKESVNFYKKYKASARIYFYQNEAQCEKNLEIFLKCIDAVTGATSNTGFAAIKLTALGRPQLLLQLSEVIARTKMFFTEITGTNQIALSNFTLRDFQKKLDKSFNIKIDDPEIQNWLNKMDYDKIGLMNLFSWNGLVNMQEMISDLKVLNIKTGKLQKVISCLTNEEEEMFRNMMRRIHQIAKHAKESDVRVMIDAEQTYFQPAINRITMEMMRKYNKEKAIIFNTYQCYLKNIYENILIDLELAQRQNFYFGAKLVRGAYMLQERASAKENNYDDPINPTYEETNNMYHKCLTEFMKNIVKTGLDKKKICIMVATHNENTVRFTVEKMKDLGIDPKDKLICFGQLLGMCDHVSFPLGQSGYSVYKYVPYGPIDKIIPYLSRRAIENHDILKKVDKEKKLIKKEIFRRLGEGRFFYKPIGLYTPA